MPHRKTFALTALALFVLAASAPAKVVGSGRLATDTRPAAGAHGVELAAIGELTIVQAAGGSEELVVEAEDNLLPLIETSVGADGVLLIKFHGSDIRPTKDIKYRLTVHTMDKITLSGSGDIRAARLSADRTALRLPGSGGIRIEHLETADLSVALSGSGEVKLAGGKTTRQTVDLSGSGTFSAARFQSDAANVSISGSGDAKVRARETLDVRIGGSGEVEYSGDPKLNQQITGSGSVSRHGSDD